MSTAVLNPSAGIPAYRKKPSAHDAKADKHAAGILHVAPDGAVLLLYRSPDEKNFGGHWALPGGGVQPGEDPAFGARREAVEEMGTDAPDGPRKLLESTKTPTGGLFHTYVQMTANKFAPKLNGEHSGFTWAPMNNLPGPMHPAVDKMIRERVGAAADMSPEDWEGLRDGFLQWLAEEEAEPEHADDELENENQDFKVSRQAHDALPLALDRESVRRIDDEGRLHVAKTNICKACVSPYIGNEIPDFEALGLDADKTYYLLRDPEELQKAAPSFNNLPLLRKHLPTSADDHPHEEVVGAIGNSSAWEDPYLTNGLVIWPKAEVQGVDSKSKHQLSPGYKYRADMTPGIFGGMRYDGVMRDITGNHVALVENGRQGPDVVVGDSGEKIMKQASMKAIVARQATIGALVAYFKPRLAMDAKISVAPLFKGVPGKKFAADILPFAAELKKAAKGKMAKDADLAGLAGLIQACANNEENNDDAIDPTSEAEMEAAAAAINVPPPATDEHAQIREFLKGKGMGDEDIKAACDLLPKAALGKDDEKEDDDDDDDDDDITVINKDEKKDDDDKDKTVKKSAMDEAIRTATVETTKRIRQESRERDEALRAVRPIVGEIAPSLALDTAEAVYRHALKMKKVASHDTLHVSALRSVIDLLPKAGAAPRDNGNGNGMAHDEEARTSLDKFFPDLARIKQAG